MQIIILSISKTGYILPPVLLWTLDLVVSWTLDLVVSWTLNENPLEELRMAENKN
jgi:hypothetical protein